MLLGTVTGSVWATKKVETLAGQTFLQVETGKGVTLVCADCVGAGVGETVLIATGGAARRAAGHLVPVDAAVVGILDAGQIL